jgi:hypothetical protein
VVRQQADEVLAVAHRQHTDVGRPHLLGRLLQHGIGMSATSWVMISLELHALSLARATHHLRPLTTAT